MNENRLTKTCLNEIIIYVKAGVWNLRKYFILFYFRLNMLK